MDRAEKQMGNDRSLDELGEIVSEFGVKLPDDFPLLTLFRWQDPELLTQEQRDYNTPEWDQLKQELNSLCTIEKTGVKRAFGSAVRAGIKTVGELRFIKESELATSSPSGAINRIGPVAAEFLKIAFCRPEG